MYNVLLVGGPADGMRVEQSKPSRTIRIVAEGLGEVEYLVHQFGKAGFIAAPAYVDNPLAYVVARYPAYVEPNTL